MRDVAYGGGMVGVLLFGILAVVVVVAYVQMRRRSGQFDDWE